MGYVKMNIKETIIPIGIIFIIFYIKFPKIRESTNKLLRSLIEWIKT